MDRFAQRLSTTAGRAARRLGLLAACAALACPAPRAEANPFVRLDYNLRLNTRGRNTVFLELFDDRPLTRDNFLLYVNGGHYDESLVHRLARNFVLQFGGYYPEFLTEPAPVNVSLNPDAQIDLDGNLATPNPTVNNEYGNSPTRSNVRGTIAMARRGGLPNSADSEWFVNLGDNTGLDSVDGGFTVFAQVAGDGMTLYDAYNGGLTIVNLNPDRDDNGVRDSALNQLNPFGSGSTDGVPVLGSNLTAILVIDDAQQVDYFDATHAVNVPGGGLSFTARDAFFDAGTTFTGAGTTITVGAGRKLGIREAITVNRTLVNNGTLEPGFQIGRATLQAFTQSATGVLGIQIFGTTVDTLYDQLVVTGAAQLAGTLDVTLSGSFNPAAGNSFTVLTAGSIAGAFSTINLPQLNTADGLVWDVVQNATSLTLNVVRADYNHDGIVEGRDFLLWQQQRGQTGSVLTADGTGDGVVDNADYLQWARLIGRTDGGATSVPTGVGVPEPAGATLALVALLAAAARRRALE